MYAKSSTMSQENAEKGAGSALTRTRPERLTSTDAPQANKASPSSHGVVIEMPFDGELDGEEHWEVRSRPVETLAGDFVRPPAHAKATTLEAAREYATDTDSIRHIPEQIRLSEVMSDD